MSSKKLNAKSSLCWTCKHGLCIQEQEEEKILSGVMTGMPEDNFMDPFDASTDEEVSTNGVVEQIIEHERIKTICFWRPEQIKDSPPVLAAKVSQCNRFEAQ